MNLQQFKSWKLLYEDQDLCFSKAVLASDKIDVFFITFFKPESLSKATRLMLETHLSNFVGLIEDDGKLHLVLKEQVGHPIKKFIAKSTLTYDDRVQVAYSYLKHIALYDDFPDAIRVQLVDDEQCLINDDGLAFRELVDYTLSTKYEVTDVFKQIGITLDIILHDSIDHQSQFIDNLIIGKHNFTSLEALKVSFKDVFIYEKPEAIEAIESEYTIILNDFEAGPPINISIKPSTKKVDEPVVETPIIIPTQSAQNDDLLHDDLQRELASLLIEPEASIIQEPELNVDHATELSYIETEEENEVEDADDISNESASSFGSHTKSFKAIFEEDDQLPDALPKSAKQRIVDEDDDDDLLDEDMSQIFDDEYEERSGFPRWIILIIVGVLILSLTFWGFGRFFSSEPVSAMFVIEPLRDDRIAFMNTSTGEKHIEAYSWEIYYEDTLVQTFTDKNLFPVFDTEGDYKIVLKVKDKNGAWSEPYTEVYEFRAKEQ